MVALDLSDSYRPFARDFFPHAQLVADKFHVLRLITPAIHRYIKQLELGRDALPLYKLLRRNPSPVLAQPAHLALLRRRTVFVLRLDLAPWVSLDCDASGQATDSPFAKELTHPRAFGSAPRLLGHYARDKRLFSVEETVRKMASLPARRMRLADRGLLRPGMATDITARG